MERRGISQAWSGPGSCAVATGDLNVVMQKSTDGGQTWSKMSDVSPGFPASGGDSAALVVQPNGQIDVLYQGSDYPDVSGNQSEVYAADVTP